MHRDYKSDRHAALSDSWPAEPIPSYRIRPAPIPTRPSWVRKVLAAAALVAVFAALGVLFAWRG